MVSMLRIHPCLSQYRYHTSKNQHRSCWPVFHDGGRQHAAGSSALFLSSAERGFSQWQPDSENRSQSRLAFAVDCSVMCLDDGLRYRQSEAAALSFRRWCGPEKPFEDTRQVFFGNTNSLILKTNPHIVLHFAQCDSDAG